jgi:hypothetical protein
LLDPFVSCVSVPQRMPISVVVVWGYTARTQSAHTEISCSAFFSPITAAISVHLPVYLDAEGSHSACLGVQTH